MIDDERLADLADEVEEWSATGAWETDAGFWALVKLGNEDLTAYEARLAELDAEALLTYAWRFRVLEEHLDEAARPFGPTDSEDGFEDLLGWFVARGRDRYAALRNDGDAGQVFDWSKSVPGVDLDRLPGIELRHAVGDTWYDRYDEEMPQPDDFW